MFKRSERVTTKQFLPLMRRADRRHFPHLSILTVRGDHRQVAVVVGKKVAKQAVRRNMLKRRVLGVLQEELTDREYRGVFIVLLKPTFNSLSRNAATQELRMAIADTLKTA